jgi:2-methylcitrate dehydratase
MSVSVSTAAPFDELLITLADYASAPEPRFSPRAHEMAALCLMDAIACLAPALDDADCQRIIGPIVPGATLAQGARVPGTPLALDPVRAAFSTSALIRWLDFSDTTYNGGHPSDNIGAILACADYRDRNSDTALTMADVLDTLVIAYEIQGQIADACKLDAPAVGLDAVLAVKIASAAAAARLLGGTRDQVLNAISSAFVDGPTLNVHRHPPNSGTRKGWAGARAASSGVELALMAIGGEQGYPTALTAKPWGFYEVILGGKAIALKAELDSGIVEHVIFKLLPCQRNGTTAVEAALQLHQAIAGKLPDIAEVVVHTHAEALERIDNGGILHNAAARDHSLQFMVAAALVHGGLTGAHYHAPLATDARVLDLVPRVHLVEDARYTAGYRNPAERSCANAVQVVFRDGSRTDRVEVRFPAGHPARRAALRPLLEEKFTSATCGLYSSERGDMLRALFTDAERLAAMRVSDYMSLLCRAA